jgi:hypothetical protein
MWCPGKLGFRCALALSFGAALVVSLRRQTQSVATSAKNQIRVITNEVTAAVTVTDPRGEFVLDLSQKDFHVFDDGTHDLALTEIATNGLPGRNVYFEDSGESGALSFDYKLRQGVLSRSNALNIAHLLGIDTAATESD